jgi:hypothetical protein
MASTRRMRAPKRRGVLPRRSSMRDVSVVNLTCRRRWWRGWPRRRCLRLQRWRHRRRRGWCWVCCYRLRLGLRFGSRLLPMHFLLGFGRRQRGELDKHRVGTQFRSAVAHGHELEFFGVGLIAGERERDGERLIGRHSKRTWRTAGFSAGGLRFCARRFGFEANGVFRRLEREGVFKIS